MAIKKHSNPFLSSILLFAFLINGAATGLFAQAANEKSFLAGEKRAETITAEWLRDNLSFVASDEMEGRDTPSRGLDLTAKFIALNLKQWGVKPAGDNGTYFQRIALRRRTTVPAEGSVQFGGKTYKFGDDFLSGVNAGKIENAPLVFLKSGWIFKAKNVNPYKSIDVRGKVVVMSLLPPKDTTQADVSGQPGVDYTTPIATARENGALAVIEIPSAATLKNWKNLAQNQTEKGVTVVEKFIKSNQATIPNLTASAALVEAIFAGEKIGATAEESFAFDADKKISINVAATVQTLYTQNVAGVVEGSDGRLKNEYVAFGAHYDHVGVNLNEPGADKIWNGADDDGSGTTAILAMARAFATGERRAKRSILFVWHCGEEKGLWGSKYFSEFPTVPLAQVAAQLNIDMIGRTRPAGDTNPANKILVSRGEIYVIGSKKMSSELGALSEKVNADYLKVKFNYAFDDLNDPHRFFYRSDHFHYARKGVPIIFYFDGEHEDYHRPGGEVGKIDFEQMQTVARMIFMTGWELANQPLRPKVDKPLTAQEAIDPF